MTPAGGARPIHILLVEDDPGDVLMTAAAFEDAKVLNRLEVVRDGDEALARLRREGRHAGAPRPDLVLLDLGLPRRDGRAVLADIRADPAIADVPVVVLTSSRVEIDHLRARRLAATAYVTKPVDLADLVAIVGGVDAFFISVVRPRSA